MYNKTDIVTEINKEVWIPAIKETVDSWVRFSESCLCETPEYKTSAIATAVNLLCLLSHLQNDCLTYEEFETLIFYCCD